MTKKKVKTMSKDMLTMRLREALKDVHDANVRYRVCHELFRHLVQLEILQAMPYVERAVFWKCHFYLFDYLRINGQVQREPGEFDDDVKDFLRDLLVELEYPDAD